MRTEIERLVKQLSELQVKQTAVIERTRELESTSAYADSTALENTENENTIPTDEDNPEEYCYDRYNKRISIDDWMYLSVTSRWTRQQK